MHKYDPSHTRNVHCTCGAEYSLYVNLNRHIAVENTKEENH